MIDAAKGQQTQTHPCYKYTSQVIKKRVSRKQKRRNTHENKSNTRPKSFVACMYISGDNIAQIDLANSHFHMAKGHNARRQASMLFLVTVLWQK